MTAIQRDTTTQNGTLATISKNVTDIQLDNARSAERFASLDARVEHNRTVADGHDLEQVKLIREEREAREAAMIDRRKAHDSDISEIKTDIKEIRKNQSNVNDKMKALLWAYGISVFIVGAATVALINQFLSGHLSIVVHP